MRRKTRLTWWRDSMAIVAGAFVLTALVGGSTASAGGGHKSGWTAVSGTAVPSDCGGDAFALELSGDLEGCWAIFPEDFSCEELNGFALYRESGREQFDGTRSGEPGQFITTYTFEAAYAQGFCESFDFLAELAGGCDHHIRGISGSFRGVVGHITFFDIIPGISTNGMITPGPAGATDALYVGQLNR